MILLRDLLNTPISEPCREFSIKKRPPLPEAAGSQIKVGDEDITTVARGVFHLRQDSFPTFAANPVSRCPLRNLYPAAKSFHTFGVGAAGAGAGLTAAGPWPASTMLRARFHASINRLPASVPLNCKLRSSRSLN